MSFAIFIERVTVRGLRGHIVRGKASKEGEPHLNEQMYLQTNLTMNYLSTSTSTRYKGT